MDRRETWGDNGTCSKTEVLGWHNWKIYQNSSNWSILKITGPVWKKHLRSLFGNQQFLEDGCSPLLVLDSSCNLPAPSQPCSPQTGPHNPSWLWPISPATVCSEFSEFHILTLSLDLSQIWGQGEIPSAIKELCSVLNGKFFLQFQLYLRS